MWLVDSSYQKIPLTLKDVSWSRDSYDMIFLTDNPIEDQLSESMKNMPLMPGRRMLPEASIGLDFEFKFMMTEEAAHDVLPSLDLMGDLYLEYPMEDP